MGTINFSLGAGQVGMSLVQILFIIPKLNSVYAEFNAPINTNTTYLFPFLLVIMGIVNLFLGLKLLKAKPSEKILMSGIVFIIISFVLGGFLMALSSISTLGPIYNLAK